MFSTNNHDYLLQQAGMIQNGEITTRIHDSILRNAALAQSAKTYRPTRYYWTRITPLSWITQQIRRLISGENKPARKQIREDYHPAAPLPGN